MKTLLGALCVAITLVLAVPMLFANGGTATTPYACGHLDIILDTIRTLESGGNYTAHAKGASAAGAYQYITTTWQHWATQAAVSTQLYPTADTAPPAIQDQVASVNITSILATHDNNIDVIPVIWYYPAALNIPTLMDRTPSPEAGNTLTVRQYQTRWLDTYNTRLSDTPQDELTCGPTDATGQWALPLERHLIRASALDDPHHDYPAWDYLIPTGTPIYAITGGTVANTTTWNGNWWQHGCAAARPPSECSTCGTGVTIERADGLRHTYCHASRIQVFKGDQIAPGQHIADSGNTGRSGTPHLHIELRLNGVHLCPQPILTALYEQHEPPALTTLSVRCHT